MNDNILINPIGYIHSEFKYRYETPRQAALCDSGESYIELLPHNNYEQAVINLEGFERIWVIFQFHLNHNWKPMVTPPRHTRKKVGVFATRAPYRPNQIGMSCVRLINIQGLKITITDSDILDGAPVLDIKPYLPYSDSFPDARTGWVKGSDESTKYIVAFETLSAEKMLWLKSEANINLRSFVKLQLEFSPVDDTRKRIEKTLSESSEEYILSYRTWRIRYIVNIDENAVTVMDVYSAYDDQELFTEFDKYEDKAIHLKFKQKFEKYNERD